MDSLKILIVDDDCIDRENYQIFLQENNDQHFIFKEASFVTEAFEFMQKEHFDALIIDYNMPGENGLKLLQLLKDYMTLEVAVIMLTGQGDENIAANAFRAGVNDYLVKHTLTAPALQRAVHNAVEKNKLNSTIKIQTKELRRQNEDMHRLYHTLSHELKTPLTSMHEFLAILIDEIPGRINGEQRMCLHNVKESCELMTLYINDLVDLSMLENNKIAINITTSNLKDILSHCVMAVKHNANNRKIKIECENIDYQIKCDHHRMEQICINLLNNAIKFSPINSIIKVKGEASLTANSLNVHFIDQGCGVEKKAQKRIFDRFYQVDPIKIGSNAGLGIGLNLCKLLIEKQAGEISVMSNGRSGTTFTLSLPLN